MPITYRVAPRQIDQEEFGKLSYDVMRDIFAIHNELGRFFDERIYKRALAVRRDDVLLEEPIDVSFRTFTKRYFVDALVAGGGLFEFKAADRLIPRHRAQLLHYLMLTGLRHGMLVNVRPEKIEREFVNSSLSREDRFRFNPLMDGWDDKVSGAATVRDILLDVLADWGTCLQLSLYEQALVHFLGGESGVVRPVQVMFDSVALGEQSFRHAADNVAFKLTAFENPESRKRFLSHTQRLVTHTGLKALLCVNIARDLVTFTTVT